VTFLFHFRIDHPFQICKIAARDKHESVVSSAFELIERILRENFNLVVDAMPELVDALVSFGLCPFLDFALQSISHLTRCSQVSQVFCSVSFLLSCLNLFFVVLFSVVGFAQR
jgi:hypothetical protein